MNVTETCACGASLAVSYGSPPTVQRLDREYAEADKRLTEFHERHKDCRGPLSTVVNHYYTTPAPTAVPSGTTWTGEPQGVQIQ